MIDDLLQNGFAIFAYMEGSVLRFGFIVKEAVATVVDSPFPQLSLKMVDAKDIDAEKLSEVLDMAAAYAHGVLYDVPTSVHGKD